MNSHYINYKKNKNRRLLYPIHINTTISLELQILEESLFTMIFVHGCFNFLALMVGDAAEKWAGPCIRELLLTPSATLQDCKHGGGKKV